MPVLLRPTTVPARSCYDFMRRYVQEHADTLSYDQWFRAKVAEGIKAVEEGRVVSNEEAKCRSMKLRKELLAQPR